MKVMTGDEGFEEAYNKKVQGGEVDMFVLFDACREEGKKEGKEESAQTMVYRLVSSGSLTLDAGAEALGISIEELKARIQAWSKLSAVR